MKKFPCCGCADCARVRLTRKKKRREKMAKIRRNLERERERELKTFNANRVCVVE